MRTLIPALFLAFAAAAPPPMTEAQVAGALNALDLAELDRADYMAGSTQKPGIKAYAARQLDEHAALDRNVALAVSRLGLQAEDSPVAASARRQAAADLDALKGANAPARDPKYLEQELRSGRAWLETIDGAMAPSAKTPDVKALVTAARASVERDLSELKRLQQKP